MTADTLSPAKVMSRSVGEGSATKSDVEQTKLELQSTLIIWFVGTTFTLAAIIIAVVRL